jgi:UDP-N-acetylglucosamine transferase subunit ALG13
MIFVTVGSSKMPFDRLLRAVGELSRDRHVLVQTGASSFRPPHADHVDFMSFEELTRQLRDAELVITHAGVGSIMAALMEGKRPLVVPRRSRFDEAVDDHQVAFARRLADAGLVDLVEDPADLRQALGAARAVDAELRGDGSLARELRAYISNELDLARA